MKNVPPFVPVRPDSIDRSPANLQSASRKPDEARGPRSAAAPPPAAEVKRPGTFSSDAAGVKAFMGWTDVGKNDTPYNHDTYNCQGFADALAKAAVESKVATDARLVGIFPKRPRTGLVGKIFGGDVQEKEGHALTEITTKDGTRYLLDAQTGKYSAGYQLTKDGEIPAGVKDGFIKPLWKANYDPGQPEPSGIAITSTRAPGDTWTPEQAVTNQSQGLNSDRARRAMAPVPPKSSGGTDPTRTDTGGSGGTTGGP